MKIKISFVMLFVLALVGENAFAGPYSGAMYDPGEIDSAIPGWIGMDGLGKVGGNNYVNPIFVGWATGVVNYSPSETISSPYDNPSRALGPVNQGGDVVSLGDLSQNRIDVGDPPGEITLSFGCAVGNGSGADFAVFENSFIYGSPPANVFAELGYVGISTDGINFAYFAGDSLTTEPVGPYGCIDPTDVYDLAGKHVNNYGNSWGTPFDLATLSDNALVLAKLVSLSEINYVRIVDIPGSGDFLDATGDPIYDAWKTCGTGGVDLDAIGIINTVPEPATILLIISGFLGIAGFRRKLSS
jgi:hypothetical protein